MYFYLKKGGVLADMRLNINNTIQGLSKYQLFIYSAHDNHILGFYKLLELNTEFVQPEYGSAIVLELRQSVENSADYFVQVYLKNNKASEPINLQLLKIAGLLFILVKKS